VNIVLFSQDQSHSSVYGKKEEYEKGKPNKKRNFAGGWNGIKNLFASEIVPLTSEFVRTQS